MAPQEMPQERVDTSPEPVDCRVVRNNVEFALSFLDRAAREASERGLVGDTFESIDDTRAQLERLVAKLQLGEHFGSAG